MNAYAPQISKAESSYIQAGLTSIPGQRIDGRALDEYRIVALETGVAPLANGSARVSIGGRTSVEGNGGGGTEVVAATKLEVESVDEGEGVDGGRVVCTVTCSPAAYPHLSSNALEDLQYDLTTIIDSTLSHSSLHPKNLTIVPGRKAWCMHLDLVVLADQGNVLDVLFLAARAAVWDTRVPRTKVVEWKARPMGGAVVGGGAAKDVGGKEKGKDADRMDVDDTEQPTSGFDTRQLNKAVDFELPDYWDEGEPLEGSEKWPVCVTLNLVPPIHFLDASSREESAVPLKFLLIYSFEKDGKGDKTERPVLRGMRFIGPGEVKAEEVKGMVESGKKYAQETFKALNQKLASEDSRRGRAGRKMST
ncbi:cytidylyltransferase [Coprinopsis cinerea AmutBmut pab1-1]|nr:cytidylyltransferase [Coprinopsis cinerea AmutBmut pab1-1]